MTKKFFIEQVALYPRDPEKAMKLLAALGMTDWAKDVVVARGRVMGDDDHGSGLPHNAPLNEKVQTNVARLAFNYQATRGLPQPEAALPMDNANAPKPLELEVLHYDAGVSWMDHHTHSVSHLGMHCDDVELAHFRKVFRDWNIGIAQEVDTVSHVNPVIAGKRWYRYVIFNTHPILGVDLKFIIRRDNAPREI